jgi:hypothetical protein
LIGRSDGDRRRIHSTNDYGRIDGVSHRGGCCKTRERENEKNSTQFQCPPPGL